MKVVYINTDRLIIEQRAIEHLKKLKERDKKRAFKMLCEDDSHFSKKPKERKATQS